MTGLRCKMCGQVISFFCYRHQDVVVTQVWHCFTCDRTARVTNGLRKVG